MDEIKGLAIICWFIFCLGIFGVGWGLFIFFGSFMLGIGAIKIFKFIKETIIP